MSSNASLTSTDIIAVASETLERGGYRRLTGISITDTLPSNVRCFEDPYSIIELVVYETWNELHSGWTDAQATLVDLISEYVRTGEAKAGDGYLVLFTPSFLPSSASEDAALIRYNTKRVRKLLGTGDELKTLADVEQALQALLPVSGEIAPTKQEDTVLSSLPEILAKRGIPTDDVRVLVDAFLNQKPFLEQLHQAKYGDENS